MASIGTNDKNKQLQERKRNQFDFWDVQRMKNPRASLASGGRRVNKQR